MLGDLQDVTGDGIMADPVDVAAVVPVRPDSLTETLLYRRGYQSVVTIKPGVRAYSRTPAPAVAERVNRLAAGSPA